MKFSTLLVLFTSLLLAAGLSACPKTADDTDSTAAVPQAASAPAAGDAMTNPPESPAGDVMENPHGTSHSADEGESITDGVVLDADGHPINSYARGEYAEAIKLGVQDMVKALQDGDREAFQACFTADSPELEEMLAMFDDWQGSGNTIEISKLEVSEAMKIHAIVEYEFSISEAGAAAEPEDGKMEMLVNDAGKWVIQDID